MLQHEKPTSYPQYATTHALKYYILVQDAYDTEDSKAQEVFTQMQNAFGASTCHLLQLNSLSPSNAASSSSSSPLASFWLAQTHRDPIQMKRNCFSFSLKEGVILNLKYSIFPLWIISRVETKRKRNLASSSNNF